MVDLSLNGKTALITGGSRGLGLAVAESFAAAGGHVMIAARDADVLSRAASDLSQKTGAAVCCHVCDVARPGDLANLFQAAQAQLGRVDILVNNAGGSSSGPFEKMTDEDWQYDLDLKLFAAIRLSRLVLPGMRQRQWGRILNTVSVVGKTPGAKGAPTCVSRAAGIALTKAMAGEYAPFGITVNALCAGWIMSEQWPRFHQRDEPDLDYDAFIEKRGKTIPMGRLGRAEEFAAMACFLASDAASYVTGTAINVDGGKSPVV
jgi:3-oxoacyl-[acyl-carrier protein] reductase